MKYFAVRCVRKSLSEFWKPGEVIPQASEEAIRRLLSIGYIAPVEDSDLKDKEPEKEGGSKNGVVLPVPLKKRRGRPSKTEV